MLSASVRPHTPPALYALTAGAFGIGITEFVIMGLLLQVSTDLHVGIAAAGLLISGYTLGVFIGAPLLAAATRRALDAVAGDTGKSVPQLRQNLGAVGWNLSPAHRALLDAARAVTPPYPYYPYWNGPFAERNPPAV